jgi:hypothetical protein
MSRCDPLPPTALNAYIGDHQREELGVACVADIFSNVSHLDLNDISISATPVFFCPIRNPYTYCIGHLMLRALS